MNGLAQVSGPLNLYPAYGVIYTSKEDAIKDWSAGADFKMAGGGYCSVRDSINLRFDASSVWICWNRVDCVRVL